MRQEISKLITIFLIIGLSGCGSQPHNESQTPNSAGIGSSIVVEIPKPFIEKESLSENDLNYVEFTKSLYLIRFKKEGDLTEKEKGAFFKWVISTKHHSEKCESWWNQEKQIYEIPYSYIKHIILTHLDTEIFDPEEAFNQEEYDSQTQLLEMKMIGGYGGAAALEVLSIKHDNGIVTIELGSFDMEKFYADLPEYILREKYVVQYSASYTKAKDLKILSAQ